MEILINGNRQIVFRESSGKTSGFGINSVCYKRDGGNRIAFYVTGGESHFYSGNLENISVDGVTLSPENADDLLGGLFNGKMIV